MERFIADLVRNFESGRINRRQFCEAVTLAASVCAMGDAAKHKHAAAKAEAKHAAQGKPAPPKPYAKRADEPLLP